MKTANIMVPFVQKDYLQAHSLNFGLLQFKIGIEIWNRVICSPDMKNIGLWILIQLIEVKITKTYYDSNKPTNIKTVWTWQIKLFLFK